jgi:hypothetical protein
MNYVETIPFIILISAKREDLTTIPKKADSTLIIICPAAFVNYPIRVSILSYSMSLTLVPGAVIFFPIRASEDARPILDAILNLSLVDISAFKFEHSLAMR